MNGESGASTGAVAQLPDAGIDWLNGNWQVAAAVLAAIVVAAIAYVGVRRRPPRGVR